MRWKDEAAWRLGRSSLLRGVDPIIGYALLIGRLDLALQHRLGMRRLLGGHPFVQVEHPLHQRHHVVVARHIYGVALRPGQHSINT